MPAAITATSTSSGPIAGVSISSIANASIGRPEAILADHLREHPLGGPPRRGRRQWLRQHRRVRSDIGAAGRYTAGRGRAGPSRLRRVPKFCRHGALADALPDLPARASRPSVRGDAARPRAQRRPTRARAATLSSRGGLRRAPRGARRRRRLPLAARARAALRPRTRSGSRSEIGFAAGAPRPARARAAGPLRGVAAEPDLEEATLAGVPDRLPRAARGRRPVRGDRGGAHALGRAARTSTASRSARAASHDPRRGSATIDAYLRFAAALRRPAARRSPATRPGAARSASSGSTSASRCRGCTAARATTCSSRWAGSGATRSRRPGCCVTEEDPVTLAAKRVFGIGDRMTLERRARELAAAVAVPGRGARPRARELGASRARSRRACRARRPTAARARASAALAALSAAAGISRAPRARRGARRPCA